MAAINQTGGSKIKDATWEVVKCGAFVGLNAGLGYLSGAVACGCRSNSRIRCRTAYYLETW